MTTSPPGSAQEELSGPTPPSVASTVEAPGIAIFGLLTFVGIFGFPILGLKAIPLLLNAWSDSSRNWPGIVMFGTGVCHFYQRNFFLLFLPMLAMFVGATFVYATYRDKRIRRMGAAIWFLLLYGFGLFWTLSAIIPLLLMSG